MQLLLIFMIDIIARVTVKVVAEVIIAITTTPKVASHTDIVALRVIHSPTVISIISAIFNSTVSI